jgi:8-oxo-dGTP diphosphatase
MTDKKQYVIGFLFNAEDEVALIEKTHPDWQKGKLNGVGGHIEEGESPEDAMTREFEEEVGAGCHWTSFCKMIFQEAEIYCFRSSSVAEIESMTEEKVAWYPVKNLPENIVLDIGWLIPMALHYEPQLINVEMVK